MFSIVFKFVLWSMKLSHLKNLLVANNVQWSIIFFYAGCMLALLKFIFVYNWEEFIFIFLK